MTPLRQYQQRCLEQCRAAYRDGGRSILIVSPTGSGKTRMGVEFAQRHLLRGGRRVLWLAHRRELIRQGADRLQQEGSGRVRVELGDECDGPTDAPIVVASVQTLLARSQLPDATLLVVDEAHHFVAAKWGELAAKYAGSIRLGLTATPERADRTALGDLFDALVVAASVRELTETGHLVPCDTIAPPRHLEGGIAQSPLAAYERHALGRRTVIFCANVRHAQETAAEFCAAGVAAACIDGEMAPGARDETLARFRSGELSVLTNVYVLTEGWDAPEAEVCILARGCSSGAMMLQAVGRVLRPAPGKARALLIDLKGAVHLHGLPGDDREYSLAGRPIRKLETLTPLSQCRECGAVYRSAPTCIRCGARLPPPKLPRELRGELSQIYATAAGEEKREYLRRMHAEAKKRGYAAGWAVMKFKAKYGHWPQRRAA